MSVFNIVCSCDFFIKTICKVELTEESMMVFYILAGWNLLIVTKKLINM